MKPQFLDVHGDFTHSFGARVDRRPNINNQWHCHSSLELIYFKRGSGSQFVGDSVKEFADGDVVLIGKDLPHCWHFAKDYLDPTNPSELEIYVVHFKEDFLGAVFLSLPEFQEIKKIIASARLGLQILGRKKNKISALVAKIVNSTGSKRFSLLIDCLAEIANCKEAINLVTIGFHTSMPGIEKERLQLIYNYTVRNYKKKIILREIAEVARVSPHSFCRFFKATNRKTYSQFLSEVRVGQACKMLIENKLSVKEICYESGFLNYTSFHKIFRNITGKTPLIYQRSFE